jgi:hypothetical protein
MTLRTEAAATVRARVERGAAFLDTRVPGWRDRIDPETLRINSSDKCVLGQLFGSYELGCFAVGKVPYETAALGFTHSLTILGAGTGGTDEWAELNREWQAFLREQILTPA